MKIHSPLIKISLKTIGFIALLNGLSYGQLISFPGAEGFGRFSTGGRGGEVYHVTNLNDTGAGSFRDAVSKSNRIVVFDVGGVINIGARIVIQKNIYVAGQTAPGGGITIYGNGVALNSSSGNSIIRYIRIRMGDQGDSRKDALGISDGQNYMFDNVSVSWGHDGTLDVNGTNIDNITFQDCIISQGIDIVGHSTGGLFQSGKWSMIRSLYIDNETRNPKGKGTHEFINNVIYNWGSDGYIMGATTGLSEVNMIGNHFIYGPSSSNGSHITRTTPEFHVYAKDNWVDSNKDGILNATAMTDYKTATLISSPFNYDGTKYAKPANQALSDLIKEVGGTPRDAVDQYLIDELTSYGKKGKIIVRESENGIPNNVGTVANGTPPKDTDKDGMPDAWETKHGLNPNDNTDHKGTSLSNDGYTNIEMYVNELAGDPVVFKTPAANLPPVITSGTNFSLPENDAGKFITKVTATDAKGGALTCSLAGGDDASLFIIGGTSCNLYFTKVLDYEAPRDLDQNNIYKVNVQVSDPEGLTASKSLEVTITDVNDIPTNEAPLFITGDSLRVDENSTEISVIQANDPEGTAINYSIGSGSDSDFFSINTSTGLLSFKVAPDFENPLDGGANNIYWVFIIASDGVNESIQKTAIHINDIDDNIVSNFDKLLKVNSAYTVFDLRGNKILESNSIPQIKSKGLWIVVAKNIDGTTSNWKVLVK